MLVLLLSILIFRKIDKVDYRFSCKEVVLIQPLNVLSTPISILDPKFFFEKFSDLDEDCQFILEYFIRLALNFLLKLVYSVVQMLLILKNHFRMNNVEVSYWINVSFIMDDSIVVKGSHDVVHSVNS